MLNFLTYRTFSCGHVYGRVNMKFTSDHFITFNPNNHYVMRKNKMYPLQSFSNFQIPNEGK